ncbi:hypothetical protein, partial [Dietzia sp. SYD-A1]|uniref:hypothetical protein n=1 Tax=Dietzia sp. SYD-A1 TaxID=2780141 RepID=UPI001E5B66F0
MHDHAHPHTDPATARVVVARGPESEKMPDLGIPSAAPGRELHDLVTAEVESGALVVVVPMTFGRAPAMIADCSRTLRDVRGRTGAA